MAGKINWRNIRSEIAFFAAMLAVFMIFRTAAYGMYHIPSESMLPTLAVGDRIAVNKFAYGYSRHSTPFSIGPKIDTPMGRVFARLPARGDIVVFKHPQSGETYIKRVIGLPGEKVEIINGRLFLNEAPAALSEADAYRYREHRGGVAAVTQFAERLPGAGAHNILERGNFYPGDNFGPVTVADNHLFVMGDNRDNSQDSRFDYPGVGQLPIENLVGRAELRVFSTNFGAAPHGLKSHKSPWLSKLR